MATGPTFISTVASLIQKTYTGQLAIALNESSPIFQRLMLKNRVVQDQRLKINWPIIKGEFTGVTTINDGGKLPDPGQEDYADASLQYKIYLGTVRLGRLLQIGAAGNNIEVFKTGDGATLLEQQVNAAIRQIARNMHKDMAKNTSTDTKDINALGDIVASTTNSYAGISRVGNAFWQPYVNANAGVDRALTIALLRDIFNTMTEDRGVTPEEVWCGRTAFDAMADLIGANVRQFDPNNLNAGAETIHWKGIPFVFIPNMDPNAMWWLDFTTDGGMWLKRQHKDDFIVRAESTDSYDDRISIAGHYQLQLVNPFAQAALLDVQ